MPAKKLQPTSNRCTPLENSCEAKARETEITSWAGDQKERGYYYDDAHGYEMYDPANDDSEDNEDAEDPGAKSAFAKRR